MARIAIVGAGVAGVASAWLLCRQGHEVTLIDRNAAPGQGASRANGAQLSYAYCDALASPGLIRHLPEILLGRDPAYRARLTADPEFLLWGLRFLANATPARFAANTGHLLALAAATRRLMGQVLAEIDADFGHATPGKMILFPTAEAFERARPALEVKRAAGIEEAVLDRAEATVREPALALYPDPVARVVFSEGDAIGRPDRFCAAMVERMRARHGLTLVLGHEAARLLSHRGRVAGVAFPDRPPVEADLLVLATGEATGLLPLADRLQAGVRPMRGYSITAPATPAAMRVSITDLRRKIVFARLGDELRIAGLADIGARPVFDAARFRAFAAAAAAAFGPAFRAEGAQAWSGARPCTPSSRPVIGPASLGGLYLNIGHGTLGWTLCLGTAERLVASLSEGPAPSGRQRARNQTRCPKLESPRPGRSS